MLTLKPFAPARKSAMRVRIAPASACDCVTVGAFLAGDGACPCAKPAVNRTAAAAVQPMPRHGELFFVMDRLLPQSDDHSARPDSGRHPLGAWEGTRRRGRGHWTVAPSRSC